jgi:hypothetical protein
MRLWFLILSHGIGMGPWPCGWSELAATNALVEDDVEAILGMNQKHVLPAQSFWFSHLLFCPEVFPSYLPPSLLLTFPFLPPPSYLFYLILRLLHCQSSGELQAKARTELK